MGFGMAITILGSKNEEEAEVVVAAAGGENSILGQLHRRGFRAIRVEEGIERGA
jgi:hypothetical protein